MISKEKNIEMQCLNLKILFIYRRSPKSNIIMTRGLLSRRPAISMFVLAAITSGTFQCVLGTWGCQYSGPGGGEGLVGGEGRVFLRMLNERKVEKKKAEKKKRSVGYKNKLES